MSIDVGQFHQVFFEESHEGLQQMETILLEAKGQVPDPERINALFRVVHSVKGGAGTFGFSQLTEFAHTLETLMDAVRHDQIQWSDDLIPLLLESTDALRHILQCLDEDVEVDAEVTADLSMRLQVYLQDTTQNDDADIDEKAAINQSSSETSTNNTNCWKIDFVPHRSLFHTGNDPARLFEELAELGELTVEADDSALPAFTDFEPEDCFLSWHLQLLSTADEPSIREIFDWVEFDCDLTIHSVDPEASDPAEITEVSSDSDDKLGAASSKPTQAETVKSTPDKPAKTNPSGSAPASSSIRVETDKIDGLINMVGELVITQSMLAQMGKDLSDQTPSIIIDRIEELERNTRDLQEGIMQIRMLPISFAFNRFPRLVHDLSAKMGKQVNLKTTGEKTELDKSVMEKISDPLVHLVRNSLDHGLESPEVRTAKDKSPTGELHLNAYHQGGNIVVEIKDDGAGLNTEKIHQKALEKGLVEADANLTKDDIHNLIFLPGFSTADEVSDISGRGVGMDVVRKNITELGGTIDVYSKPDQGSTFTIRLPLTLAIMDGQSVQVGSERFIIPLLSIVESVEIKPGDVKLVSGKGELYLHRQEYLPVIRLQQLFNLPDHPETLQHHDLLVILEAGRNRIGLLVDDLLGQQQAVIKSLETNFRKVPGVSAATILGDGAVALILDIPGIWELHRQYRAVQAAAATEPAAMIEEEV